MCPSTSNDGAPRIPLNRERVLRAAIDLADADGIEALSMRHLGQALGVEAMSLYNHVANKEDLLDGMVDLVVAEIDLPGEEEDWRTAMRARAVSAHAVMGRHPWASGLMESRSNPGPASLRYYDSVLGSLRRGGFSVAEAAHAFATIDSFIYGFALQQQSLTFDTPEEAVDVSQALLQALPADEYPYLVEMILDHVLQPGYDFDDEFDFGLDLILDGFARLLDGT